MEEEEELNEEPVNDEELEFERTGRNVEGYADDDLGMDAEE